jgi:FixJ family two-component response regulator
MNAPTVFIVDDDAGMRYSLPILFETAHLRTECFASAEDFLQVCDSKREGCLLLDVRMTGMNGLALQEELVRRDIRLPIIFLTAYADLATGVAAMKRGAADFLTKPVNGALLVQQVRTAIEQDRQQRREASAREDFEKRLLKLTRREREILVLALSGRVNKDISTHLGISLRTIEGHRSRIYMKTGATSMLELAQQAADAGVALAAIAPSPEP